MSCEGKAAKVKSLRLSELEGAVKEALQATANLVLRSFYAFPTCPARVHLL